MSADTLPSWRDTPTREAIVSFTAAATREGDPGYVPPAERIAVFDNDGTLWPEKPMPVELDFIVREFAAAAESDASLRDRQPFQAAYTHDLQWLGAAVVKHYQGDDGDLQVLLQGVTDTFTDLDVDTYAARVLRFFETAEHPTHKRPYRACAYAPMIELLRHVEAHGFATYIVSGGDRDFMRPIAETVYEIPRERVVGSSLGLGYEDDGAGGAVVYKSAMDFFDDGPQKPLHIWARTGQRPALACGNSNGDLEMLRYAGARGGPALRLLVVHDDAERDVDDQSGADRALAEDGVTQISVARDWDTVFTAEG